MIKKLLMLKFILCLISCSNLSEKNSITKVAATSSPSIEVITTTPVSTGTSTPANLDLLDDSGNNEQSNLEDTFSTVRKGKHCMGIESELVEKTAEMEGLILNGIWENGNGLGVLGISSLESPTIFLENDSFPYVPQNGELVAYLKYIDTIDAQQDIYTVEMIVTDLKGEFENRILLTEISLSRSDRLKWADNLQLVLPLKNKEDEYQWLVWDPIDNEQNHLTVEIPSAEENMNFFHFAPIYDPLLDLVLTPCNECQDAVYNVYDLDSGQLKWSIDFDDEPLYGNRSIPVWSPDGQYLAIVGNSGNIFNVIYVFDRDGNIVYKLALPERSIAPNHLSWSPNSEYLAFVNTQELDSEWPELTISYFDLNDSTIVDLCVPFSGSNLTWSPDSSKFAISNQIEPEKKPRLISIVDVSDGNILQLMDVDARQVVGWR